MLAPGQRLNAPVIGAVAYGDGYVLAGRDGGIFNFSDRPSHGSPGGNPPPHPIVGVATVAEPVPELPQPANPYPGCAAVSQAC